MFERSAAGLMCVLVAGCYDGASSMVDTDGSSSGASETGAMGSGETGGPGGEPEPEDVPDKSVPDPLASRLTHRQYANAIEDALGTALTDDERSMLPEDVPVGSAYSTTVQGQIFSAQYVLGYASIARSVVQRLGPEALTDRFGGCAPADEGCLEVYVESMGLQLHRRPLTDAQRDGYLDLAAAIESEADREGAVVGVAEAMLQSPFFLYRIEDERTGDPGAIYRVDGYELATRLSFFLWQSGPDDALLEFAAGFEGAGDEALVAEIDRMLADPKFARSRRQFWGDYTLASVAGYATADPVVREELRESLLATLDRISGVDGPADDLRALFDGTEFVMTPSVAALAGVESAGEGLQTYDASDAEQRYGVLTHPGFLAALGTTSFVGRGLFMSERLLCQHIAPPPSDAATADAIMDTAMQTEDLTPREASEFRFGLEPVCLSCHTQFEPIAYAFERYDMLGAYATTDEQGRELYSDGLLPPFQDRPEIPFADAAELFDGLAADASTYHCMVENMFEYASGHPARSADDAVEEATATFESEGRTFEGLVRAVAEHPQLTYKKTAEEGE